MYAAKGVDTLMVSTCKPRKHDTNVLLGPILYRSSVEALQYLTLTRANIVFYVNKAFQFMVNSLETHFGAVKRIMRYLSGTKTHGLMLAPVNSDNKFSLVHTTILFGPVIRMIPVPP